MNIFPEYSLNKNKETDEKVGFKEIEFDFKSNRVVIKNGKVTFLDEVYRVKQWVEILLRTELGKYRVYDDTEFGILSLYKLRGNSFFNTPFGVSELERELKEKIKNKKEVKEVVNFSMNIDFNTLKISFTIKLKSGNTLSDVSEVDINGV